MFKRFAYTALLFCLALTACQQDLDGSMSEVPSVESKIINTKSGSAADKLLVKFDSAPTEDQISALLATDIAGIERLFPSVPGKEKLEKECGLDKWYVLDLGETADIDAVAHSVAAKKFVTSVEYDAFVELASDRVVYPYEGPVAATKAAMSDLGFNDPILVDQWNYLNLGDMSVASTAYAGGDINIKDTWRELTCGDPSIVVAVVDEGVEYSHPDLAPNMWVNEAEKSGVAGKDDDGNGYVDDVYGYNFGENTPEINFDRTENDTGHGTHCAGVIGAVNNNGIGVSSVAGGSGNGDGVRLMSCQIFSGLEGGTVSTISRAVKYAADNGASIISCSFGQPGANYQGDDSYISRNAAEMAAIRYFENTKNNDVLDGGVVIFASGNAGDPYASYPGAINDIICVSAFGPDYLPTYYTNYGPGCNIVAPGGEAYLPPWTSYKAMIISTVPKKEAESGYGYMQGTSMACPHVSGIAALGIAYAKKLGKKFTREEFNTMLVSSANDFDSRLVGTKEYYPMPGGPGSINLGRFMKQMGTGSVDTWIFMMKIEGVPCLTAEVGKNGWVDVSEYFGTSSKNLTYLSVEVSDKDREALGLAADPYMEYGRLYIHPTKIGSGKVTIKAVGGGTVVGGGDVVGGMEITQEVSIISRPFKVNNGGWL